MKYKVIEKIKILEKNIYEIEANSADEAVKLYCEKLAGSINPINCVYEDWESDTKESIVAIAADCYP